MTNYTEQTSASDRIEAARKALADLRTAIDGPHPAGSGLDSFTLAHISHVLDMHEPALRTLITQPAVGESEEQIAQRIGRAHRDEYADTFDGFTQEDAERIALQGVRAGIQSAYETWEPEVAQRPSQEQMLRWLGIQHVNIGSPWWIIPEQIIEKEEI